MLVSIFLTMGIAAWGQNILVTGKVTDASTGEPVPGAAVLVKGGTGGAVSDLSGVYSITVASNATLVCSCIGYVDIEKPVSGASKVDFALKVDAELP